MRRRLGQDDFIKEAAGGSTQNYLLFTALNLVYWGGAVRWREFG